MRIFVVLAIVILFGGCAGMPSIEMPQRRPVVLYQQQVPMVCLGGYDHYGCSNGKDIFGGARMMPNRYPYGYR